METEQIKKTCNDFHFIEEIAIDIAKEKITDKSCGWDSTLITRNYIEITLRNCEGFLFFVEIKYEQIAAKINHKK